jgi:hypothetical protein
VIRIAAPDIARLVRDYLATEDADGFVTASHMGLAERAAESVYAEAVQPAS